jgi:hypothetical protein
MVCLGTSSHDNESPSCSRVALCDSRLCLESKAFALKDPQTSYKVPKSAEPVITIVVVPKPPKLIQELVKAPGLSRITSGGTSDGKSPFCQRRTTTGCVEPQHKGKLVIGSGGVTNAANNHASRTGYKVVTNTEKQICIEFFAATGACETELYIQGTVTALEEYEQPL